MLNFFSSKKSVKIKNEEKNVIFKICQKKCKKIFCSKKYQKLKTMKKSSLFKIDKKNIVFEKFTFFCKK